MPEVLSQQEIDQLLSKVKTGDEQVSASGSENEAIPFDFRLPNRISKNQLRTLRNIHESFAESFSSFLVSKLQSIVNVSVLSIDQIYYSEYILSVLNPACLFTFDIKGLEIKGILEFSTDFAITLVDRLLGGSGNGTKQSKIITPIEQKVLGVIVERVMLDLKKGWQIAGSFDFSVGRFESDIDFAQITSHNESVLLISFEIAIGEQVHMMNICFATDAFDTVLSKLSSQKFSSIKSGKNNNNTSRMIITNSLYESLVPVIVEFGKSVITVQEVLDLEPGDIIKLDTKISDEHTVRIDDKVFFTGRAGILNDHKAIKITKKFLE
jgi:flagellar motor switch protein FliM